jgi:D-alanyl-D-alanine carboxypeptidase
MSTEARTTSGPFPTAMVERIDAIVRARMVANAVLGAAVGVWLPGHEEFLRAYGTADARSQADFSIEDKVRIGSITKTFTATAVLLLVDRGILRLDDRLETFTSGVPHGDRITVRNLLNMTAGVYDYTEDPTFSSDDHRRASFGIQHVLRILQRNLPSFCPGAPGCWQYSNSNYALLGLIIETVSTVSAANFIHREIVDKVGLLATSFPEGTDLPPPSARGYLPASTSGPAQDVTELNPGIAGTSGAMISTIRDLRTWSDALVTGSLLSPESHAEQFAFVETETEGVSAYGAGVVNSLGYVGHNGSIPGFGAAMFQRPKDRATIIVIANTSGAFENETFADLVHLLDVSLLHR